MKVYLKSNILLFILCSVSYSVSMGQSETEIIEIEKEKTFFNKYFTPVFFLQSQYDHVFKADTVDVVTMSGGDFPTGTNSAFTIRRGRLGLQFNYENILESRITFDVTDHGFIAKDIFFVARDPWIQVFDLSTGHFRYPFGYEVAETSVDRLFAERSRVIRHLFPSIRDVGAKLTITLLNDGKFDEGLKLEAAVYNGNNGGKETNNFKDFVFRGSYNKEMLEGRLNFGAGLSYFLGSHGHIFNYGGGNINTAASHLKRDIFQMEVIGDSSLMGFNINNDAFADSLTLTKDSDIPVKVDRRYIGVDANVSYQWSKSKGWKTSMNGQYIQGTQPGTTSANFITPFEQYSMNSYSFSGPVLGVSWKNASQPQPDRPTEVKSAVSPYHTFIRSFRGASIAIQQELANTGLELGFRFDMYDPNTEISGKEVREDIFGITVADIKYTTYGIAVAYSPNKHFKITAAYDIVRNEIVDFKGINADGATQNVEDYSNYNVDVKDDALMIRLQIAL